MLGVHESTKKYGEFEVDAEVGDTVYVVYVTYGSGDSFGHSSGNLCVVDVLSDRDDANKFGQNLREAINEDKEVDFHGRKIRFYEFMGYFEHDQRVYIEPFTITEHKSGRQEVL